MCVVGTVSTRKPAQSRLCCPSQAHAEGRSDRPRSAEEQEDSAYAARFRRRPRRSVRPSPGDVPALRSGSWGHHPSLGLEQRWLGLEGWRRRRALGRSSRSLFFPPTIALGAPLPPLHQCVFLRQSPIDSHRFVTRTPPPVAPARRTTRDVTYSCAGRRRRATAEIEPFLRQRTANGLGAGCPHTRNAAEASSRLLDVRGVRFFFLFPGVQRSSFPRQRVRVSFVLLRHGAAWRCGSPPAEHQTPQTPVSPPPRIRADEQQTSAFGPRHVRRTHRARGGGGGGGTGGEP